MHTSFALSYSDTIHSLLAHFRVGRLVVFGFISTFLLYAFTLKSEAQTPEGGSALTDSIHALREVTVSSGQMLGSKFEARNRTGSAYYVSPQELKSMGYTDIGRILRSVPGVNLYEEDGFGLRPNISLRGTKAERSERITIMEDGILAAPAPYAAPAAYYFPNAGRMSAIEVLKGSSQVQYGPFTTGGAINLVSTPIPRSFHPVFTSSYGSFNTFKSHLTLGNSYRFGGFMAEYLRYQSDGYRRGPRDEKTPFERNDWVVKGRLNTDNEEGLNHALEIKVGYAAERSDETYVGLSEADFAVNPRLRYAGTLMDNLTTRHLQTSLTYRMELMNRLTVQADLYRNSFHRNWYKLNDIRIGSSKHEIRGVRAVLEDPLTNEAYLGVLRGERDFSEDGLIVRANNRNYKSQGFQTKAEFKHPLWGGYLSVEGGFRAHYDEEDRFTWEDAFAMREGSMKLFEPGIPGTQANRITSAQALSSYLLSKFTYRSFTITAGVRYEDVYLLKQDFGKEDVRRTGKIREEISNHARGVIPGIGLLYKMPNGFTSFVGVHKGFAPPGADLYQKPESSINSELGARYTHKDLRVEAIAFLNHYSHMLGSDLQAMGGQGTLEQFNIGEAVVKGMELLVSCQPLPEQWGIRMPLQLTYTYTNTRMLNTFYNGTWGQVTAGDEIPYIFRNAANLRIGLETGRLALNAGIRYNGNMRTAPGQGEIARDELIPSHTTVDGSFHFRLSRAVTLTMTGINLTNLTYISSRHPAGIRMGHPLGIYAGLNLNL